MRLTFAEIKSKCHGTKSKAPSLYYVHRLIALPITFMCHRAGIRPDTISITMVLVTLLSFLSMLSSRSEALLCGFILAYVAFLLDKVDGDLARLSDTANVRGVILDFVYHRLNVFCLCLGVAIHHFDGDYMIIAIGASCGFLANYIEEAQLLANRAYAHKVLEHGEEVRTIRYAGPSNYEKLKVLKFFRVFIFLLPLFALFSWLERSHPGAILFLLYIIFFCLLLYAVCQLRFLLRGGFEKKVWELIDLTKSNVRH